MIFITFSHTLLVNDMENGELLSTSYSKKEWWIDSATFLVSSGLLCAAKGIALIDPAAIGLLLSAGANTAAIQASSAFSQKYGIDSRFIQVCALISALALSTLAFPWILSAVSLQTFALLSFENAVESTLVHLAFKTAAYSAFHVGLYIKNSFTVALPTSLKNVQNMSSAELKMVRDHLVDFPSKARYLSLPVHQKLHARLKEDNLKSPPLTNFSEIGEGWSDRDLDTLHKQDLRALPLYKRAQINELFFARDFPPQQRPYELNELPELDSQATLKLTTSSKASWAHLILRLNSKTEIPTGLPKLFYKYGLPPVRDEWIPLRSPPSLVSALEEFEIGWYQNFYAKHSQDWKALSPDFQNALKARFKNPSFFFSPPTTPLLGRISQKFPWNQVATGVAIGAFGIAAYYALSSNPIQPEQLTVSTALVPEKILESSTPVAANTLIDLKITDVFQRAAPYILPTAESTLYPELPLILSPAEKIQDVAGKTLSFFPSENTLPSMDSFIPSTWSTAPIVTTLVVGLVACKFIRGLTKKGHQTQQKATIECNGSNKPIQSDLQKNLFLELKTLFEQGVPKRLSVNCFYQRGQRFFLWGNFWRPEQALASLCRLKKNPPRKKIAPIPGEMNSQTVIKRHKGETRVLEGNHISLPSQKPNWAKFHIGNQTINIDLVHPDLRKNLSSYLKQLQHEVQNFPTELITIELNNQHIKMLGSQLLQHIKKVEQQILTSQKVNAIEGANVHPQSFGRMLPLDLQTFEDKPISPSTEKQCFTTKLKSNPQKYLPNYFNIEFQKPPTDIITLKINRKLFSFPRDKLLMQLDKKERLKNEKPETFTQAFTSIEKKYITSLINQISDLVPNQLPPDTSQLDLRELFTYLEEIRGLRSISDHTEITQSIKNLLESIKPPPDMTPPPPRKMKAGNRPLKKKENTEKEKKQNEKYLQGLQELIKDSQNSKLPRPRRFKSEDELRKYYKEHKVRFKVLEKQSN